MLWIQKPSPRLRNGSRRCPGKSLTYVRHLAERGELSCYRRTNIRISSPTHGICSTLRERTSQKIGIIFLNKRKSSTHSISHAGNLSAYISFRSRAKSLKTNLKLSFVSGGNNAVKTLLKKLRTENNRAGDLRLMKSKTITFPIKKRKRARRNLPVHPVEVKKMACRSNEENSTAFKLRNGACF
jgi:hypothetical protein